MFALLGEGRTSLILSVSKGSQFKNSLGYTEKLGFKQGLIKDYFTGW